MHSVKRNEYEPMVPHLKEEFIPLKAQFIGPYSYVDNCQDRF